MLGANKRAPCFPKRFRSLELLTDRHWFEFELDFRVYPTAPNVSVSDVRREQKSGLISQTISIA